MKILISGASGLVGTHLIPTLKAKGHEVYKLVRKKPKAVDEIEWDATKGIAESELPKIENFGAVIHLAGDNVADGNWTDEKKRKIKESRTIGTRVLIESLKKLENPPKTFIAASAIGFYGNRGDEVLTEDSAKDEGFFPEVCSEWEAESEKAADFGARVVMLRIGVVLSKDGGAIAKMLTPFKLGVGGVVGSGKQWMSWIELDDLIRLIHHALDNENVSGALNAVAPNPVTNEEFTKTFGKVINRPTIIPIPEFAIKLLFGEMGENTLLASTRVLPEKTQNTGFDFKFNDLESALKHALK